MRKIITQATYKNKKYPVNWGPKKVETAGYIPPKIQIENMMIAGFRLDQARKLKYDYESVQEQMDAYELDITRRAGYDPAEASRDARAVSDRLIAQGKLAEAKKAEDLANKAREKAHQDSIAEGKPEGK